MLTLYNSSEISLIDELTIHSGVTSIELIDRAAEAFTRWLLKRLEPNQLVQVICGPGNNGADGIAVALKLEYWGYPVGIFCIDFNSRITTENKYYKSLLRRSPNAKVTLIRKENDITKLSNQGVVVDAILGNGINRKLEGKYAYIVKYLNANFNKIYAVDVPTGISDNLQQLELGIHASETFSFQFPKLSFFAPEHYNYVGKWNYKPIGLKPQLLVAKKENTFLIELKDIRKFLRPRSSFSHKGLMGRSLFIMNNSNMYGAGLLSAHACLRMGAGYTYCLVNDKSPKNLSAQEPELIFIDNLKEALLMKLNAVCIGPGLGLKESAEEALKASLNAPTPNLVLDADALNIIADKKWHDMIPKGAIITPHIGEFERLFGKYLTHSDRINEQKKQAVSLGIHIILKGRYTSIAGPDGNIYYNCTGNPSLAKGGSGDILSGILTAFCTQGYSTLHACIMAVFIHGLAADVFIEHFHEINLTPLKLIDYLPIAMKRII